VVACTVSVNTTGVRPIRIVAIPNTNGSWAGAATNDNANEVGIISIYNGLTGLPLCFVNLAFTTGSTPTPKTSLALEAFDTAYVSQPPQTIVYAIHARCVTGNGVWVNEYQLLAYEY
jgi:hypothetical protein